MRQFFAAYLLVFVLAGCGSSVSKSVVNSDGSWSRTIKLKTAKVQFGLPDGPNDDFPEIYSLPTQEGWTKTEAKTKEEKVVTLTKELPVNADTLTDLIVREKGETRYKNFVYVRPKGDGTYEYYEKILSTKPKEVDDKERKRMAEYLKKTLPQELNATDTEVKSLADAMFKGMVRNLLGPDDFIVGLMMFNQEAALRRIEICLGKSLEKELTVVFGSRINESQRSAMLAKIVEDFQTSSFVGDKSSEIKREPSGEVMLGISSSLVIPGKLVSTNGSVNPFTGVIYWDLTTTTVDVEPLELRATFTLEK